MRASGAMMEYFFEDGDPSRPRTELVTRDELWNVLEWHYQQVILQNTWRRRLWRSLRRWPSIRFDPFAVVRVARLRAAALVGRGARP